MLANRIENQPQNSNFFPTVECFLLLHNRVGLHACHKKVGLAPSSQLSLKCISASSLCNFERLILGSVVSACQSGNTNSATGSYFRCPGIIFQTPRHHILDAQASYFRCSSIQRRYNETLAFTGTEPLQIDGPMILLYLKSCLGSHPEELNKLKME